MSWTWRVEPSRPSAAAVAGELREFDAYDLVSRGLPQPTAAEVARKSGKCFVYFNNFSGPFRTEVQTVLRAAGVPYLQGLRESLKAIKALIRYHLDAPRTALAPRRDLARQAEARAILAASGPVVTEDKAQRLGAALAYYAAFSMAPLLIIVVAVVDGSAAGCAKVRAATVRT